MDIDDKQNLAPESQPHFLDFYKKDNQIPPPDSHATIDDKQTSPHDSHPPNAGLDEHDKQIPSSTIYDKQTSPHDSHPPNKGLDHHDKQTSPPYSHAPTN